MGRTYRPCHDVCHAMSPKRAASWSGQRTHGRGWRTLPSSELRTGLSEFRRLPSARSCPAVVTERARVAFSAWRGRSRRSVAVGVQVIFSPSSQARTRKTCEEFRSTAPGSLYGNEHRPTGAPKSPGGTSIGCPDPDHPGVGGAFAHRFQELSQRETGRSRRAATGADMRPRNLRPRRKMVYDRRQTAIWSIANPTPAVADAASLPCSPR